ncbi:MAG: hypothetical protein M1818_000573 [Claussenomyces sp. TS43310]|nr:MAG: hypothetical protein M1818_000573 [Claussenomyces sp. TS43310]
MSGEALIPLPQGAGYGVVVGIGLAFGLGMLLVTKFLEKFMGERSDHSEMFMVANRSVGTGLTASAVISSWMWAYESPFPSNFPPSQREASLA